MLRIALVALVLAGCTPLVGSPCDAGTPVCTGAKSAAFCEPGGWAEYSAPGGCTTSNGVVTIDFTGATGECPGYYDGHAACAGDQVLTCSSVSCFTDGGVGVCVDQPRIWRPQKCLRCHVQDGSGSILCEKY